MEKLSIYIVTLNEEERLGKTLAAAVQVADEIIIVDSGSIDKTCEIAESYGAKVIFHQWKNISSQKNFAQNQCENDWVMSLDADEVLSNELIAEIKKIKENPAGYAYKVRLLDMMPGEKKPPLFTREYNQIRLYHRAFGNMPDDLTHDRVVLKEGAKVIQLENIIHHYSFMSLTKTWEKLNDYSNELVNTMIVTGKSYSIFRLPIEMPYQWVRYYFFKRMWVHGRYGFIMATTLAYFRFLKIAKWIERQENLKC